MSFSVTGPLGPHIQHMGAARGSARHAVTKHRIVAKPSLNCPSFDPAPPNQRPPRYHPPVPLQTRRALAPRPRPRPRRPRPCPSPRASSPQKSHVIWVPSLFLGPEKTLQFQRSNSNHEITARELRATFLSKDKRGSMRATDAGPGPRGLAPASSLPPGLVPQKSHVIWVPSLFLGPEKTLQFQRSQFKS